MLTLFSCPKPFTDPHVRQIQRNAIGSWTRLAPRPEILLLGDEDGAAETAVEFHLRHVPGVVTNERGTPRLDSIFSRAESDSTCDLLCYVNADIILLDDFMAAVRNVAGRKKRFVLVGRRWDIDIGGALDFSTPQWQDNLLRLLAVKGSLHAETGIDYLVFPRYFWHTIPPFALGRTIWDQWLLGSARRRHADLIDATEVVTAIHQNHDYAHIPGGRVSAWKGDEAARNRKLARGCVLNILDANWLLTPQGLTRARTATHRQRARISWPIVHPILALPGRAVRKSVSCIKRLLASRPSPP